MAKQICTRILIALVVLFLFELSIFSQRANAYDDGSLMYYSYYEQTVTTNQAANDAFSIIDYIFEQHSSVFTERYNGYGDNTNLDNILSQANYFEDNHDGLSFLHYGHWWTITEYGTWYFFGVPVESIPITHWTYTPSDFNDTAQRVKDSDIFINTDEGKHYGVFLWTCVNGYGVDGVAGDYDSNDYSAFPISYYEGTGARGMPYAFTQQINLKYNGYSDPDANSWYAFMGFKGTSKGLLDSCQSNPYHDYQYFLCDYYYHVLNSDTDYSINSALDATCRDIWGPFSTFGGSPIHSYYLNGEWCGLQVWGNGNLKFPK